jgi:non-specific protein-tyrosine kinase
MTSSSTSPEGVSLATVSRNGRSLAAAGGPNQPLVMLADRRSPTAEAYRSLAAMLQFAYADRQMQTIGITSASAGEGKSLTVANLAVALAEGGRRVVVIDADLRQPTLHAVFGVGRDQGLTDVLLGEAGPLPLQETLAPGVRLLSSGSPAPNPLDVLASRRLDQILATARAQAEF